MHPAVARLQSGSRIPIENIVCQTHAGVHRWAKSYMKFAQLGGQSLELHKQRLGRQDCTWTGSEYRHWVWEAPRWTVTVSKRGVEFNVPPDVSIRTAWELWREYLKKVGLT